MKLYFKYKLNTFYHLIIIGLGTLLGFFYYNFQKTKSSTDMVEHTEQVLRMSNDILLDIITVESGTRGFILTGNRSFLNQLNITKPTIQNKINALKLFTKDNPRQQNRMDSIIKTGFERVKIIEKVIKAKENNSLSVENTNKHITESLQITSIVRNRIKEFNDDEFKLLKLRKAEKDTNTKNSDLLLFLFFLALLGIFGFIAYIIKNQRNKIIFDEKIKETENLYHEMIYSSPSMIGILKGPEMIITIANDAILESWGKGKNVIGQSLFKVLPEIVDQGFDKIIMNVYNTGEVYKSYETPVNITRNGQNVKVYYSFTYQAQRNLAGKIEGIAIIANEVTAQAIINQKLKESEIHFRQMADESKTKLLNEYSRSLIEASHDPLFTISPNGKITDINSASVLVTGLEREKLIDSDFINYFTDPNKAKQGYEAVFEKGFVVDFPLVIKDHKLTDVLFNGSVYKDENGNVLGAVVVARDITEQKNIEKELNEAKVFAEMATEIAQIAKEKAESATLIAENAVKSKQQFLSNMSHEIRTPMNAIIGFTKVVLKTNLSAKQKEYMAAIKMSGDALIVLINDILDLAKVEAGKMTFEQTPFKLSLSIEAMVNLFEPRIQEKNLVLEKKYDKNIPDILVGDAVRLHQIIMNLVSNALKFTKEGKIILAVKMVDENEDSVTINFSVTDTGIGIAEDKLESVFENFNQATLSTSRIYGGTGLGLAIVKQLVESQGGSIAIKSTLGVGSTFSINLTFQKTKDVVILEPEIMELDREIRDVKVLVVEDMALNQLLMKTLLDDFGFECDITFNGKLAVEKLESTLPKYNTNSLNNNDLPTAEHSKIKPYDIILMDLQMPEMNGYEATEYIRKVLKSDIPIIALTADVASADVAKCKEIGMNDYISKPVNERLLYSKIVALVKKPVIIITETALTPNKPKTVDLSYLLQRTKSNPKLMVEMITVYLEQTPPLLFAMKQGLKEKDWKLLEQAVHKMLPSFSIMGMSTDFESMARKIQEYATAKQMTESIHELVNQLDTACTQACEELKIELENIMFEKIESK